MKSVQGQKEEENIEFLKNLQACKIDGKKMETEKLKACIKKRCHWKK